jgi:hypothetical protein
VVLTLAPAALPSAPAALLMLSPHAPLPAPLPPPVCVCVRACACVRACVDR